MVLAEAQAAPGLPLISGMVMLGCLLVKVVSFLRWVDPSLAHSHLSGLHALPAAPIHPAGGAARDAAKGAFRRTVRELRTQAASRAPVESLEDINSALYGLKHTLG
ncbi:hypothetical protein ABPG75_009496 [Micractinium tetrahymenae]